ncbi:MAG: restriction endonuclease subunit S [Bacteroidota bacterium]
MTQHVPLGQLFDIIAGGTPSRSKPEYFGGAIPWVKISDMLQGLVFTTEERITEAGLSNSSAKIIPKGTLLISIFATVGRTAELGVDAATNQAIVGLVPKKSGVNIQYIRYCLDSKVDKLIEKSRGVAQNNINKAILSNIELPLPNVDTQNYIANILSEADKARQLRHTANTLTDQFLQSTFLSMFGDPVNNPMGWEVKKIEDIIIEGPQNGLYVPSTQYGEGTPILRIDSFYDGYIDDINSLKRIKISSQIEDLYSLQENDFVINRVNSRKYLGKSALIPKLNEKTVFESNMMKFRIDIKKIAPQFFIYQLQQNHIKRQILKRAKDSVNQSSINQSDVKSFTVFIPPLKLQKQFADIVTQTEELRKRQLAHQQELEQLFKGLLQKYFG